MDVQGGGLRVRELSTQGDPTQRSPSFKLNREVIRRTKSYALRGLGPSPITLLHGASLAGEAQANKTATLSKKTTSRQLGRGTADV